MDLQKVSKKGGNDENNERIKRKKKKDAGRMDTSIYIAHFSSQSCSFKCSQNSTITLDSKRVLHEESNGSSIRVREIFKTGGGGGVQYPSRRNAPVHILTPTVTELKIEKKNTSPQSFVMLKIKADDT